MGSVTPERHDQLSDHINLANAIRRAHEWKLHIAERHGHMPFEAVGARLLDEILRLQERLADSQRELSRLRGDREPPHCKICTCGEHILGPEGNGNG